MDTFQVQLLYVQYGWDAKLIASATGQKETYIKKLIEENKWKISPENQLVPANTEAEAIARLKKQDIEKQAYLAPIAAVTEICLMTKINELASSIDIHADNAHVVLGNLTKAFKSLTENTISSMVDLNTGNKGVQVLINNKVD